MHRIDTTTAQKDKFGVGKNGFTRGNPQTGVPATDLDDDYFDSLQEEIVGIVEAAGDTPDKAKHNQVLTALQKLFAPGNDTIGALAALVGAANKLPYFTGPKAATLTDLTSVGRQIIGKGTIQQVLDYLTLGTAATKNVGTGENQLPDMSSFASLLTANGYMKLPGGFILQWGTGSVQTTAAIGGTGVITLPTTYPNEQFGAICILKSAVLITNSYVAYAHPTSESTVTLVLDAAANATSPVGNQPVMYLSWGK